MTNPVYRSAAWAQASRRVLERDGYRCQIRLPGCRGVATTADHIVGLADGGELTALANLQAACRPCNSAKENMRRARKARGEVRPW